jgi:hypothetical protein
MSFTGVVVIAAASNTTYARPETAASNITDPFDGRNREQNISLLSPISD